VNIIRGYKLGFVISWAFAFASSASSQTGDAGDDAPPERTLSIRLASPPGFADDGAFVESVAGRVAELQHQAAEAENAARKAGFLSTAANLILAEQLEPACTRKFFDLDPLQERGGAPVSGPALDQADALIADAETLLRRLQEENNDGENHPLTDQGKGLSRELVTLKAFAQALRAFLMKEADVDSARAARRAASGLSVILEDDNPQIAAAAAFWQACLRAMEPDPTPALELLDSAMVDPPPDAPRYGFLSRLLRCRQLAARGGPAVALALLMQVEERADGWFKTESDRADATRACAYLRLRILHDWHDRLDPTSQADERTWCRSQADTLRAERFSEASGATVLRLNQAIPIIARPPGPIATPPDGTPAPK
jgi:hypothetical protein